MTRVADLIDEVTRHGGELFVPEPGRLRIRAPHALPEPLLARLKDAKPDLLRVLDHSLGVKGDDPAPVLVLRDGRRHWSIPSHRGGTATAAARQQVAVAKAVGVILVADNSVLSLTAGADVSGTLLDRLADNAADVLAELHRASDERMAVGRVREPRQ